VQGFRSRKCWVRSSHLFSYVLEQILIRLGGYVYRKFPNGYVMKDVNPYIVRRLKFWIPLLIFSVLMKALFAAVIPYRIGYCVVAERYLLDLIADLRIFNTLDLTEGKLASIETFLLRFIPRDSSLLILTANPEVLKNRYEKRGDKAIYSERHVTSFMRFGEIFAKFFHSKMMDNTDKSKHEVHEEILRFVQARASKV